MRNYVVGSTVVAFKYKRGIVIATDTKASYGSLSKYNSIQKTHIISKSCAIGFSGEISDMQHVLKLLDEINENENRPIEPQGYHKIIQRILYSKRSKIEPLNLFVCVAGVNKKEHAGTDEIGRMLGAVDHLGNFYFSNVVCSGLGSYLVLPFLRSKVEGNEDILEKEDAIRLIEDAMKLLCYRDCKASNHIQIGIVEENEATVYEAYSISTNWENALLDGETILQ